MKSSKQFPLHQSGIYRNLPTINPSLTALTAIVTGATGISGWNTIRALLESPIRWSRIFALARSPPSQELMNLLNPDQQSRVQHIPVDFLTSPDKVAEALKSANVSATHLFCYAYLQPKTGSGKPLWSNAEELVQVNEKIFSNLIHALPLAGINPKRILLQTGGKNYGAHFGRTRLPCVESDPQPRHLEPNFYYPQEDLLFSYCDENSGTSWNVIRPFGIVGAAQNAQMNFLYALAVYAVVQAHKKEPLHFPGDWVSWQQGTPLSTARLTGYLSEWAALEEDCKNQAFNAEDENSLSWDRFFHELCRWYGAEKGVVGPTDEEDKLRKFELPGGEKSPLGQGPSIVSHSSFSLVDWAKDQTNKKAWREIMVQSDNKIVVNPFEGDVDQIFGMADVLFLIAITVSMNKAKRFGWTGAVDTLESSFEAVVDMEKLGMLPSVKVAAARPMI